MLFYAVGLLLSLPMLRRLHRRFHTWRAPAIAIAVFSAIFALSNLVIGPALAGGDDARTRPQIQQPADPHAGHHD